MVASGDVQNRTVGNKQSMDPFPKIRDRTLNQLAARLIR